MGSVDMKMDRRTGAEGRKERREGGEGTTRGTQHSTALQHCDTAQPSPWELRTEKSRPALLHSLTFIQTRMRILLEMLRVWVHIVWRWRDQTVWRSVIVSLAGFSPAGLSAFCRMCHRSVFLLIRMAEKFLSPSLFVIAFHTALFMTL